MIETVSQEKRNGTHQQKRMIVSGLKTNIKGPPSPQLPAALDVANSMTITRGSFASDSAIPVPKEIICLCVRIAVQDVGRREGKGTYTIVDSA